MKVAHLLPILSTAGASSFSKKERNLASTNLVTIKAGSYEAGHDRLTADRERLNVGRNRIAVDRERITVDRDFLTLPGEITNAQVRTIAKKFGDRPNGAFMRDKKTGYRYLYGTGVGVDVSEFETLDARFLPPEFGSFDRFVDDPSLRERFELDTKTSREIIPSNERYKDLFDSIDGAFNDDEVAATFFSGDAAQALAQLLNDKEMMEMLLGLSGNFYVDLLTSAQWGLMAMEGTLEFMTQTGDMWADDNSQLKGYNLREIVRADRYPKLPNGIYPNTTWNRVKDFCDDRYQFLRGGSYGTPNIAFLFVAYRRKTTHDSGDIDIGFRVGAVLRKS